MDIDSITVAVIIIIMSYNFNYFISSKKFLAYMLAIRAYNIDSLISRCDIVCIVELSQIIDNYDIHNKKP